MDSLARPRGHVLGDWLARTRESAGARYYSWVEGRIEAYSDKYGTCHDAAGMRSALRHLKNDIRSGDVVR
jgi:hypothetical protein